MPGHAERIQTPTAQARAWLYDAQLVELDALLESGQFIEAAGRCAAAIEADPNDYAPYLTLGKLAEIAGDDQKAAEYFSEAIVRNVECGAAFAHLSRIFRKLGQLPHAVRALQVSMAMNAAGPDAPLDLADMLFELGDNDNARNAYQAVLDANPECSRSRAILKLLQTAPSAGAASAPVSWSALPESWQRVHISIIAPEINPHWQGFAKTAESFAQALSELGSMTTIACNEMIADGINVIFGAHLIASQETAHKLPASSIIFNLEQISGFGLDRYPIYKDIVSRFGVWDYSRRNVQKLREITANPNIVQVAVGYTTNLTCVPPAAEQTTDVLFYGSLNARRDAVLNELKSAGLNVKHLFNVYGHDLDAEVAKAKVVLNMHFYEDSIHEIVRTSYLMANRKAVVSECNTNTEIDPDIRDALRAVPYEALPQACIQLVRNSNERDLLERAAFENFSRRSQAHYLKSAILETAGCTSTQVQPRSE